MTWIQTITTFLIGYILGVHSQSPDKVVKTVKRIKRRVAGKTKLGAVRKLTPKEMAMKGTQQEEEDKAVTKYLDENIKI